LARLPCPRTRETNGSSEECFPSTHAPSEAFESGQPPQRFFSGDAAVAWKLVASAMLQSLETVSMKVSSFERSRAGGIYLISIMLIDYLSQAYISWVCISEPFRFLISRAFSCFALVAIGPAPSIVEMLLNASPPTVHVTSGATSAVPVIAEGLHDGWMRACHVVDGRFSRSGHWKADN
jgi:hypothetical protein